ncbi:MAG TPA: cyclic nucleotide-binding domain-containing protein [Candidatus Cloacimonadota bacterium]|nr:cyclic nucleotide-binding domain-containing protein [Candidatus Cloacimonadota bacterium]
MNDLIRLFKSIFQQRKSYLQHRRFSIFKNLNDFELSLLDNVMHRREFKAGEVLFETGYPIEVVFFIEKGEVLLTGSLHDETGSIVCKNQHLGLIDAYYGGKRNRTATAKTDVSAFALAVTDLEELIQSRPRTGNKILEAICKSFSQYIIETAAATRS